MGRCLTFPDGTSGCSMRHIGSHAGRTQDYRSLHTRRLAPTIGNPASIPAIRFEAP